MSMHSGVYQIVNVQTNERYIGSSRNVVSRKAQHLFELRNKRHRTIRLQEAYDRYGEDSFKFLVLEFVQTDRQRLFDREQYWIDLLNPEYNENKTAGSVIPRAARTSEAIKKISSSISELWQDPEYREKHCKPRNWKNGIPNRRGVVLSEETKQKVREANMGEKNPNYGKPKPQSFYDKMQKTYLGAVSPDGIIYSPIVGLSQFCREHGLDTGQMSRLLNGMVKSCKGWTRV